MYSKIFLLYFYEKDVMSKKVNRRIVGKKVKDSAKLSEQEVEDLALILKNKYGIDKGNTGIIISEIPQYNPLNVVVRSGVRAEPKRVYERVIYQFHLFNRKLNAPPELADLRFDGDLLEGGRKLTVNVLDANSEDILDEIRHQFITNECDVIVFNDVLDLLDKTDVIDFILENNLSFTSVINSKYAESFSKTLSHLSYRFKEKLGGNREAGKMNKKIADAFATEIGPSLDRMHENGLVTLSSKADFLNENNIKTSRGKDWTRNTVKVTYERWQKLKAGEENNSNVTSQSPKP